jgi:O2-independent ubiquinone biosynthesis accessory factor UbiT
MPAALPPLGRKLIERGVLPVARRALIPLPIFVPGAMSNGAIRFFKNRHHEVFDRLSDLGDTRFLIRPLDLPFAFLMQPGLDAPTLQLIGLHMAARTNAAATIEGTLASLLDLLEGRLDGDALFFSRELTIEGDTEAVVTLRNAVDGEDFDVVGEISGSLGRLRGPAAAVLLRLRHLIDRAGEAYLATHASKADH